MKSRGGRKTNVFDQFTPEYISSPYDVDLSSSSNASSSSSATVKKTTKKHAKRVNASNIRGPRSAAGLPSNKINLRLQSLLTDDNGEEDPQLPDSSPEAANQLAELGSYTKINEEARRKANEAVKMTNTLDDEEEEGGGRMGEVGDGITAASIRGTNNVIKKRGRSSTTTTTASSSRMKPTVRHGRVRATVTETGSDSIGSYVKSLGQHELLYKEDEILLGQQVRLLSVLEDRRYELEEEFLR